MKKLKYLSFCILLTIISITSINAQAGHWEELKPATSPPARATHAMAGIGDDKVLLFGGKNADSEPFNDTWIYDLTENTWTQIFSEDKPEKREYVRMARIGKYKVVLFGGWNYYEPDYGGYYRDTWIFDLETVSWTQMHPEINPKARDSHGMATLDNNKALLFSGVSYYSDYYEDTWIYHSETNDWERINSEMMPERREHMQIASINHNQVFLFGGWQFGDLNDNWLFDLSLKEWIPINTKFNTYKRASSVISNITENKVIMFGGDHSGDPEGWNHIRSDDTWFFSLEDTIWIELELTVKPPMRFLHNMAKIAEGKVILFGGSGVGGWPNDTWLFTDNTVSVEYMNKKELCDIRYNSFSKEIRINTKACVPFPIEIQIINSNGLIIDKITNLHTDIIDVPIHNQSIGIYFIRIISGSEILVKKLLVF